MLQVRRAQACHSGYKYSTYSIASQRPPEGIRLKEWKKRRQEEKQLQKVKE
jgi:hypothetical protein